MSSIDTADTVVRTVTVNRALIGRVALEATGCRVHSHHSVMQTMPRAPADTITITFFRVGVRLTVDQLKKEYAKRGLKPVDPHSLAAFNTANPDFADDRPNTTQWPDKDGNSNLYYIVFFRRYGERLVRVFQFVSTWYRRSLWFAGVPLKH